MKQCYNRPGVSCDLSHENTITKRLEFILDTIELQKDQTVLDIGAGLGVYSNVLSKYVKKCIGIDTNEDYLKRAKDLNKNIDLYLMPAEELSFEDNSFDNIIMIEVLEHVHNDKKVMEEVYRVLKPGGSFIVTAPNKLFPLETHGIRIGTKIIGSAGLGFPIVPWLPHIIRKHIANATVYTPFGLKNLLINQNFSISKMEFLGPNFDVLLNKFPENKDLNRKVVNLFSYPERIYPFNYFLSTIIIHAKK